MGFFHDETVTQLILSFGLILIEVMGKNSRNWLLFWTVMMQCINFFPTKVGQIKVTDLIKCRAAFKPRSAQCEKKKKIKHRSQHL